MKRFFLILIISNIFSFENSHCSILLKKYSKFVFFKERDLNTQFLDILFVKTFYQGPDIDKMEPEKLTQKSIQIVEEKLVEIRSIVKENENIDLLDYFFLTYQQDLWEIFPLVKSKVSPGERKILERVYSFIKNSSAEKIILWLNGKIKDLEKGIEFYSYFSTINSPKNSIKIPEREKLEVKLEEDKSEKFLNDLIPEKGKKKSPKKDAKSWHPRE